MARTDIDYRDVWGNGNTLTVTEEQDINNMDTGEDMYEQHIRKMAILSEEME